MPNCLGFPYSTKMLEKSKHGSCGLAKYSMHEHRCLVKYLVFFHSYLNLSTALSGFQIIINVFAGKYNIIQSLQFYLINLVYISFCTGFVNGYAIFTSTLNVEPREPRFIIR